jgi:methionine synthase / methylenetetrahydrofolate reductase(NADPH)
MSKFLEQLQSQVLLADGAMGTLLHTHGVEHTHCFDELNLTDPARVADVHRQYIDAGAQIILTNTFGANRYKLHKHGLDDKTAQINQAAVALARRVVDASFKPVLVAGDVGPLGVRIAPYGRVQAHEVRAAFVEQILSFEGVDLIVIETMTDLYEIHEAIAAAKEVAPQTPVVATMTFTRDDRTLLGDDPAKVAVALRDAGADVIGVNCSGGPAQLIRILREMRRAVWTPASADVGTSSETLHSRPYLWVKPNAGWPEHVGGRVMYAAAPEYFRDYALEFWKAGANVIGGCCGTTPEHIAAMRKTLDAHLDIQVEAVEPIDTFRTSQIDGAEPPSELAQKFAAGKFVYAVEMDPPRGLATQKLVAAASLLKEAGADVIDVADSPMARMRMSAWAVCDIIQRKIGIETTLHFPTRGRNLLRVQGDLLASHALGVRNVFVVMGDPTSIGDYPEAADNYDLVPSGLAKLIKQGFNAGVDHAGASIGQPTSFYVGAALNLCSPEPETEIKNLKRKLKAGADFFLTQPIYDPEKARGFLQRIAEETGAPLEKPVLVGVLPLASVRHANFLQNEVPGIVIPEYTMQRMNQAGDAASREGVKIAVELIRHIKQWAQGVYIMPQFHRYDLVAEIIEAST